MSGKKRVLLLIGIMAFVYLSVETVTIVLLYRTAFNEQKSRLVESAGSQARLIEGFRGQERGPGRQAAV